MMKPAVTNALRTILKNHPKRKLMPAAVIEHARQPDSPLHGYFEWDDSKAAHAYRLVQARHLIAEIEIVSDSKRESAPVFVSLLSDRKTGGYRDVGQVLASKSLRRELLATAVSELRAIQSRYDRLKELASVFKEVGRVEKKMATRRA